jgi:membrane associated rhomboid family serine protease
MGADPAPERRPFGSDEQAPQDPTDLGERVESEPAAEERRGTELFGLPMMLLIFALIAVVKGLITGNTGFTIVGAVVAGGIFLAIGLAMTVAKREDRPPS